MRRVRKTISIAALALALSATNVQAASYDCGRAMCRLFGISKAECEKRGLTLALRWPHEFQRVSAPAPGVVVAQYRKGKNSAGGPGGHVAKIVSLTDNPCRAVVIDNRRKPYLRDICSRRVALVSPQGMWTE
jgi:hypothetical protein